MADVPKWANERAWELCGGIPIVGGGENTILTAFARYITEHEQPPVDPLLIEARKVCANIVRSGGLTNAYSDGAMDHTLQMKTALDGLRRGIEIGRGQ